MPLFVIPFPQIDPVLVEFGPFAIRWYALAYIAGLLLGWRLAIALVSRDHLWGTREHPDRIAIDDLLVYIAFGIVLGGRLGQVIFYDFSYFSEHPAEIFAVWHGGMAFHGGFIGALLAMSFLAWHRKVPLMSLFDIAAIVSPIGIFFGRIANFINGELWGRPTDVPWAMVFPRADDLPRHPSQLYEAGLEGALIFVIIGLIAMKGGLKRSGLLAGLFGILYALTRSFAELYRDPDPLTEALPGGFTMGMALSLPMALVGVWLVIRSFRAEAKSP